MIYASLSLAMFAVSAIASPSTPATNTVSLIKRDPSGVPATRSFQNCVLKDKNFYKKKHGAMFCNKGIQMAECHVNSRVMNQVFAVFMPTGEPLQGEGGWYGDCCAYSVYPDASDIGEVANANYACFTWEGEGKVQGTGPPTMPKTQMIPYPVVCPSNLDPCYSQNWFSDSSSFMGKDESLVPTFTGIWDPPKGRGSNGQNKWLWCQHRCGGCKMGNWHQMQLHEIAKLGCDFDKCIPYHGNVQLVGALKIQPVGTYPALGSDVCADYKNIDASAGGKNTSSSTGQVGVEKGNGKNKGDKQGKGTSNNGNDQVAGKGGHKQGKGTNNDQSGSTVSHKGKGHHKNKDGTKKSSKRDCDAEDKSQKSAASTNTSTELSKRDDSIDRRNHINEHKRHTSIY